MVVVISESQLLIPYGASRMTARAVEANGPTDGGFALRCSVPYAVIQTDDKHALRLSDAPYNFTRRAPSRELFQDTSPLNLLRTRIADLCDVWARPARQWVSCYFDFISAQVELHRELLTRRLDDFGGIYNYQDWVYSALAPLPRAWIQESPTRSAPPIPENLVRTDFAFWIGDSVLALYVTGTETPTAEHRENVRRLRDSGAQVIEIPAESIQSGDSDVLDALLPACFKRFWEDEPFPSGPFRTSQFQKIEDADAQA